MRTRHTNDRLREAICLLGLVSWLGGCTGQLTSSLDGAPSTPAASAQQPPGTPSPYVDPETGEPLAPPDVTLPPQGYSCEPEAVDPGPAPLRRLTPAEYHYTVTDLFEGLDIGQQELAADTVTGSFDNIAVGQAVSPLLVEQYVSAAQNVAALATDDLSWMPCPRQEGRACLLQTASWLGQRAWRHRLSDDERQRIEGFAGDALDEHGFDVALRMVIEGLLESPQFLYRPEFGRDGQGGELSDAEMATRLSYFLWRTAPDEALLDAADRGQLRGPALETEVRRMLDDPRSRRGVAHFFSQWLHLDGVDRLALSPEYYPELDENLRRDLRRSVELLVDELFWQGGTLEDLMTTNRGYSNDRLAPLFGIAAPGSEDLIEVSLDIAQRGGLLTQPGLLASTSHDVGHSPIYRGLFVLESLLCSAPPAPPPGILDEVDDGELLDASTLTTREYFEETHSKASCAACHVAIDGIGFAFEHYDALGRWRDTERGKPIDASSELVNAGSADGAVQGAVELSARLAGSERLEACYITHWMRYSLGRMEAPSDRCQIYQLQQQLDASGGDLHELLVHLVTSETFRSKPTL